MLQKLGAGPNGIMRQIEDELDKMPQVQGGVVQSYMGNELKKMFNIAFAEAEKMHDDYVSTEHLLLSVLAVKDDKAARILAGAGVTRDGIFKALVDIRGAQRVTDPNPEDKYQALDKFARDLTRTGPKGQVGPGNRPGR